MRKLFFFKSSSSSSKDGNTNTIHDNCTQIPGLRRSLSLSSASFDSGGLGDNNLFSSCHPTASPTNSTNLLCNRSLNPERQQSNAKLGKRAVTQKECIMQSFDSPASSKVDHDSSGNSSYSSPPLPLKRVSAQVTRVSNRVLDLYIDGEQKQDRKDRSSQRKPSVNGNTNGWRPPRIQSTAPDSPTPGGYKEISRSYSFREMRDSHLPLSRSEVGLESPQKIAKNVVKRLSQVSPCKTITISRDFDHDTPTTVEDIFEDYMKPQPGSSSDGITQRNSLLDDPYRSVEGISGFKKQNPSPEDVLVGVYPVETEEDTDLELHRKAKDAEDRVMLLSEELQLENLLRDNNASVLLQVIGNLTEARRSLALEVSSQLHCRIAERASAKEALRVAKVELESQTRRLEKEKNELQSALEKELDRRSNDWSLKFEKYRSEEQRLRERVRELAEQNVSLQREVSSLNGREGESKNKITHSELHLKDLMTNLEDLRKENHDLQQNLLDLQEQFRSAEVGTESLKRSYKEKEKENKELHKAIIRLNRTCSEQEKTISGLRQGLIDEVEKKQSSENVNSHAGKLQIEQVRLTGLEQVLRREVESLRIEVESLRHENITLLDRLRCSGSGCGFSFFKLDQELLARVDCLQNQGMLLFAQSNRLCVELLELIKAKAGQTFETIKRVEDDQEVNKNGLDGYFLLESDMKVQSLKRGFENLRRSLQTVASVLHEKSDSVSLQSQTQNMEVVGSGKLNGQNLEDSIGFELKAETLLTNLLREKLFAKQLEVDQLQVELATAVRGHDILRCEVQASLDAVCCMSHKMKDLELQILRKDESINQLNSDLQECTKELTITKGILPKVSEERDLMWEKVKHYSEQNMFLNSDVKSMAKKIEFLEEDILLKEGQISILKDSLDKNPFDILSSSKSLQKL